MRKINCIDERKKELANTGLCSIYDFRPEKKTRFEFYTFDFPMDDEAKRFLKLAHKDLSLVDGQLERIERIVKAIIKIDNKTIAEYYHVAEAIQYVMVD